MNVGLNFKARPQRQNRDENFGHRRHCAKRVCVIVCYT